MAYDTNVKRIRKIGWQLHEFTIATNIGSHPVYFWPKSTQELPTESVGHILRSGERLNIEELDNSFVYFDAIEYETDLVFSK